MRQIFTKEFQGNWPPPALLGRRGFALDPSCKLWIPAYKYGLEQAKWWDQSGNNNHGTISGAIPASYPMLSGVEKITNGGMESGDPPTGWIAFNTPETFEQSGVQKHSGNYSVHLVDSVASNEGFRQYSISFVSGKTYKLSFWYLLVSGTLNVQCFDGNGATRILYSNYTTTGSWLYAEVSLTSTHTGSNAFIQFLNESPSVPAEFYIDDISIQEVVSYESLGWQFDGVDDRVAHSSLNLGKTHTLHYWVLPQSAGVVHGGAANYHGLRISGDTVGYNAGTTEVTATSTNTYRKNLFSVVRNATTVQFFQNGVQIGMDQTLLANNDLTLTDIGRYSNGTSYFKGVLFEIPAFNLANSAQEIRNYYELTRHVYGV